MIDSHERLLEGLADERADALSYAAPPQNRNSLQLVLKVAERCNIACTYCYFFFSADQSYKDHPPVMPIETVDEIFGFIERTLLEEAHGSLSIVLHGGEPLLAPHKLLEHISSSAQALKAKGLVAEVTLQMQTNGLLLTERNIEFLNRHGIITGVSIDGDKSHNDRFRVDHKGRGTYDRAIAGYQRLAQSRAQHDDHRPGILAVANPVFDGRAIFTHFVEAVGTKNLNFLLPDVLYDDPDVDQSFVDGIERFLIDVFRAWVDKGDPEVRVRFIDDVIRDLLHDSAADISAARSLNYTKLLTISSDGSLAPEDTMKSIAPHYQGVGNVRDFATARVVLKTRVFQELEQAIRKPPEKCRSCQWLGICAGDKPINRASAENGLDNPSIFCTALQSLYLEIAAWLVEAGVAPDSIERRLDRARRSPVFESGMVAASL